jgi:predicted nucleic acid-binding protein
MSRKIFLDTMGIVAVLNRRDALHQRATRIFKGFEKSNDILYTTDLVIYEVGNTLCASKLKSAVIKFARHFRQSPNAEILYSSEGDLEEALRLYEKYRDKDWGLVDCVSFNKMRRLGIERAFTQDKHFKQAGFETLL